MSSPTLYVVIAVGIIAFGLVVYYIALTVHGGRTDIDCMKHAFNQLIIELQHHRQLTAPPTC